jgi:hypothetical protein
MRSALVTFDHMQEFQKLNNPTNPQLSFIQLYDNLLKAAQPQDLVDAEAKTKQQMDRKVNTTTQERVKPISYYVQHPWTAHPNWRTLSKKDCDKVNQACSKTTKPVDFKGSGGCGGCDRCTATVAAALTTPAATATPTIVPVTITTSDVPDTPSVIMAMPTAQAPGTMIHDILSNRQTNVYTNPNGHTYVHINTTHVHRVSQSA